MIKKTNKNIVIAPLATAIWLIDNTSLTFKQIGDFCGFSETEVRFIADGVIGKGIFPLNPTKNGNLTKEEIALREKDGKELRNAFKSLDGFDVNIRKKKKYIPMLQRRSRTNAVLWLVNYCPELSDSQIIKLVRTTKSTVQMIRNRVHESYDDLVAKDPVILGFCSQKDLDLAIKSATKNSGDDLNKKDQQEKQKKKAIDKRKINVNKVKVLKKCNEIVARKTKKLKSKTNIIKKTKSKKVTANKFKSKKKVNKIKNKTSSSNKLRDRESHE